MTQNLLILGGTTEASALADVVFRLNMTATLSYAGRIQRPQPQPIEQRVGGFGGIEGLIAYLRTNNITHVVDATHPFAAQMSRNAIAACKTAGVPLVAFSRPAWQPEPADNWQSVPDITSAVDALAGPPRRVLLAIGRQHIDQFAAQPQHHYVLRLVDPPAGDVPLPNQTVVVARGPFTVDGDIGLIREYGIDQVVAKNSGGSGAVAKLRAARALGLPVIMIERPVIPARREVGSVEEVLQFLNHADADLGV